MFSKAPIFSLKFAIKCNTIIYVKSKSNLKTVRLTAKEDGEIGQFLHGHPYIHKFSTLVRAALWEFLQKHKDTETSPSTPSFLWEYDLSRGEIMEILNGPQKKRLWLVAKILENGRWNEIWQYLNLDIIRKDFPLLRLLPKTKRHWERAINLWKKTA